MRLWLYRITGGRLFRRYAFRLYWNGYCWLHHGSTEQHSLSERSYAEMTVRELVRRLLEFDLDMDVEFKDVECGGSFEIRDVHKGTSCGKEVVVIG